MEEGVSLSKKFERGWYWGSESFRERLGNRIAGLGDRKSRNYHGRNSGPSGDHGRKQASRIVKEGAEHYGMSIAELKKDRRGDWRRSSVAWAVAMETSVTQEWIAETLNLKSAANASQQIRRFRQVSSRELPEQVRAWKLSRNVA